MKTSGPYWRDTASYYWYRLGQVIPRLACFFLGHDEVDICTGDSCWYCYRCGVARHDMRVARHSKVFPPGGFAQGGYVGPPAPPSGVPFALSRGHALVSAAAWRAMSPGMRAQLTKDTDVELVYSADEVRAMGAGYLARIQREAPPC